MMGLTWLILDDIVEELEELEELEEDGRVEDGR
jgi:hypothetical protein